MLYKIIRALKCVYSRPNGDRISIPKTHFYQVGWKLFFIFVLLSFLFQNQVKNNDHINLYISKDRQKKTNLNTFY